MSGPLGRGTYCEVVEDGPDGGDDNRRFLTNPRLGVVVISARFELGE
jgi:hypothetical protein